MNEIVQLHPALQLPRDAFAGPRGRYQLLASDVAFAEFLAGLRPIDVLRERPRPRPRDEFDPLPWTDDELRDLNRRVEHARRLARRYPRDTDPTPADTTSDIRRRSPR